MSHSTRCFVILSGRHQFGQQQEQMLMIRSKFQLLKKWYLRPTSELDMVSKDGAGELANVDFDFDFPC